MVFELSHYCETWQRCCLCCNTLSNVKICFIWSSFYSQHSDVEHIQHTVGSLSKSLLFCWIARFICLTVDAVVHQSWIHTGRLFVCTAAVCIRNQRWLPCYPINDSTDGGFVWRLHARKLWRHHNLMIMIYSFRHNQASVAKESKHFWKLFCPKFGNVFSNLAENFHSFATLKQVYF